MPTRDASAGPPRGEERRTLTEASLRSLPAGEVIDSIVAQLRVRVEAGCPALVVAAALGHRLPLPAATPRPTRSGVAAPFRAELPEMGN